MNGFRSELESRFKRLQKWLNENEFAAALILKEEMEKTSGNYLYYGGSLTSSEFAAIVVDSSGNRSAVVHEYSFERVKKSGLYSKVYEIRQSIDELVATLRRLVNDDISGKNVAIDFGSLSSSALDLIKESRIKVKHNELKEFIFSQRSVKSRYEIGEIEIAIGIAKRAFDKTIETLSSGLSIEEMTRILDKNIIEGGGISSSFETDIRIRRDLEEKEVRKLSKDDLVLFDFGAKLSSMYLSDIGRTIPFMAGSNKKLRDFMNDVYSIKRAGLKKISSGKTGNKVRAEIDQIIHEHGYVSTHRPGHQIGLNVHEPYGPALAYGEENSIQLKKNNVVTWEPGIGLAENSDKLYKNRFGMAHMEEMVLVRQGTASKALGNLELEYW